MKRQEQRGIDHDRIITAARNLSEESRPQGKLTGREAWRITTSRTYHCKQPAQANSSSPWAQKHRLSESKDWEERDNELWSFSLRQIFPLGRKKLYYLFDFGDHWVFEIRKARGVKKKETGVAYPRLIDSIGPAPDQYPKWEEG